MDYQSTTIYDQDTTIGNIKTLARKIRKHEKLKNPLPTYIPPIKNLDEDYE